MTCSPPSKGGAPSRPTPPPRRHLPSTSRPSGAPWKRRGRPRRWTGSSRPSWRPCRSAWTPSPLPPATPRPSRCSGRRMPSSRPPGRSARAAWPRCSRTWSAPRGMAMWLGRVTNLSTYAARRRPRSITFGRRRKAGRMANAIPVLVVDDDAVSSAQLGALAKAAGYDVKSAYDGREAWELLQLARIPIVISDWYMPEMDGPELCRRIRSRVREPYVYFILVTARGGKQQYLAGMEAGADDFIAKPVDPDELRARLKVAERILGLRKEIEQLEVLLPICSYCKRIRNDRDVWKSLEDYIEEHFATQFSHGICPDCYTKYVQPQLDRDTPA